MKLFMMLWGCVIAASCGRNLYTEVEINVVGLPANESIALTLGNSQFTITTNQTHLAVPIAEAQLSTSVSPSSQNTNCRSSKELRTFNIYILCTQQSDNINILTQTATSNPDLERLFNEMLANADLGTTSTSLVTVSQQLVDYILTEAPEDLISLALTLRAILPLLSIASISPQAFASMVIGLVRALAIPAAIAAGFIVYLAEMFLYTRIAARLVIQAKEMVLVLIGLLIDELYLRDDFKAAECHYMYLGGPTLDLESLPWVEVELFWTSFDPREVYESGVALDDWLTQLSFPTSTEVQSFIETSDAFVELNRDAIQAAATSRNQLCGQATYEPFMPYFFGSFREEYRHIAGSDYIEKQPVRRHEIIAMIGGQEYVGFTQDNGYYSISVPTNGTLTELLIYLDNTHQDYHPDGIGPEFCNQASWALAAEYGAPEDYYQARNGAYQRIGQNSFVFRKTIMADLSSPATDLNINLHFQREYERIGDSYEPYEIVSNFVLSLQALDMTLMLIELQCEGDPKIQIPGLTINLFFNIGNGDFGRDEGGYRVIVQPNHVQTIQLIHEIMHGWEMILHGRADGGERGNVFQVESSAQDAFTEAWLRVNQIWAFNDGIAGIENGFDYYADFSEFPQDHQNPASFYSISRVMKAFLELEAAIGYHALWDVRHSNEFNESRSMQNFYSFLAYLLYLYPETGPIIDTILLTYFDGLRASILTCEHVQAWETCENINGDHYHVNAFDVDNEIGRAIGAAKGHESTFWALNDIYSFCTWGELIQSTDFHILLNYSYPRYATLFASRNMVYAPDMPGCPNLDFFTIYDTANGCDQEAGAMKIKIVQLGQKFHFENKHAGKYGQIGQAQSACPEIPARGSGTRYVILEQVNGYDYRCFSVFRDGCEYVRQRRN